MTPTCATQTHSLVDFSPMGDSRGETPVCCAIEGKRAHSFGITIGSSIIFAVSWVRTNMGLLGIQSMFHACAQGPKLICSKPIKSCKHAKPNVERKRLHLYDLVHFIHVHVAISRRSMRRSSTPRYAHINPASRIRSQRHRQVVHVRQKMQRRSSQGVTSLLRSPRSCFPFMACLRQNPEYRHCPSPKRQSSHCLPSSPKVSRRQSARAGPMQPSSV
jgi:hypothetical protein